MSARDRLLAAIEYVRSRLYVAQSELERGDLDGFVNEARRAAEHLNETVEQIAAEREDGE